MSKRDTRLADWVIQKVDSEFPDDVCLLLAHGTLKLGKRQPKAMLHKKALHGA